MKSPTPPLTVQAGHHDRAVDETEEQTTDNAEGRVGPVNAPGQVLGGHAGDGTDDRESQEAGDQHRDERGQQEVCGALEDLVQTLFDEAHDVGDGQGGDNLRLVADLGDVHAEDVPVTNLRLTCECRARVPGVEQIGGDHGCTDRGAKVDVTAEALGRGEADEDRQRGEGRGGNHVDEGRVVRDARVHLGQRLLAEEAFSGHDVVDGHHQTAGDKRRKDRNKDVGDHLDEAREDVAAGLGLFLRLVLGDLAHAVVCDHLGVDLVNIAGTDDDLEHTAGGECALQIFVVIEGLLVDLGLVRDHQAETGCAVCCCTDVGCAADCFDDLSCHLGVIHCRPHSFLKTPRATPLLRRAGRCVAID